MTIIILPELTILNECIIYINHLYLLYISIYVELFWLKCVIAAAGQH